MCDPVTLSVVVGAGIGAGTSAATGGNVLQGALLGGAGGFFFAPASVGANISSSIARSVTLGSAQGAVTGTALGVTGGILGGLAGGALNALSPDQQQQGFVAPVQQEDFSVTSRKTGSGFVGSTGAAKNAALILKRNKRIREQQRATGSLGINLQPITQTGLAIA